MCKFFSAISDGKGNVKYFKLEDVVRIMSEGNKEKYDFNSHTSISHFFGIPAKQEDKWNFWEYNTETKELVLDVKNTDDDCLDVKEDIERYLKDKDLGYIRNLYNRNSGDWNSGDGNSGNRNSGNWNSGDGVLNYFCTERQYILFDKICKKEDIEKAQKLYYEIPFVLVDWINADNMTQGEKDNNPSYKITGGYIKKYEYKKAWKIALGKCSPETIKAIKKLKNFSSKKFAEITGVKI